MEDISVEQRLKGRNQGVVLERVDWRKQGLKTQSCEMVVFLIITSQKMIPTLEIQQQLLKDWFLNSEIKLNLNFLFSYLLS